MSDEFGDNDYFNDEEQIDFLEDNKIWCWKHDGDSYAFGEVDLSTAIAGDTDSIMLSLGKVFPDKYGDVDEVVTVADTIGELTNKSFPDFCEHAFNCPATRRDTIKTDREVVSDKSLFLSKKRYIMHVVDSEGKRVDKLKIMGVEIKKSDTSKAIKSMLSELVNAILDGVSGDDLLDVVKKMKQEFKNRPSTEIAKPINVKTLKKCQDIYNTTGDMKGFPYQVRAAMFWNSMCGNRDKKIVPGDKIGLLYIRGQKSKYIGFPIDLVDFPDWFSELVVDYDTEWTKANKKIESYLSSIGMDIAGRKNSIKKELFGF